MEQQITEFVVMQLSDGSYIDTNGRQVDIQALGVDTSAPMRFQVNEQSQEELFDVTQTSSQIPNASNTLPSLPSTTDQATANPAAPSQNTIITVPSVQSVVNSVWSTGERRLVSQEPKSDLFEDHLLPNLNTGVIEGQIMQCFNDNSLYFRNLNGTVINMIYSNNINYPFFRCPFRLLEGSQTTQDKGYQTRYTII